MESDDGAARMTMPVVTTPNIGLEEASEFVSLEADLLDHACYEEWLALWTPTARYVVPIDPAATEFEDTLNYAYDDHEMRRKRTDRLLNGQSISASPVARTVRLLSRFRILEPDGARCDLRCAQFLTEHRRGRTRTYTANLTYRLVREAGALKIDQKVVRLINSTEALGGISYIL
jgi:3-phenylpropionate/cinnamic acid dioxygenase small subunit